jgi:type IV secretory pathway TrbD component
MQGTKVLVDRSISRPMLILGVGRNLILCNALLNFPLLAFAHMPYVFLSPVLFILIHIILRMLCKGDPFIGAVFMAAKKYRNHIPAKAPVGQDVKVNVLSVGSGGSAWLK